MRLGRRAAVAGAGAALAGRGGWAAAAPKIGVLTDLSGPYRAFGGAVSIACATQAVAESGSPVEIVSADHHNDAGTGAAIARSWCAEQGVTLIVDVPTTPVALAVAGVVKEFNRTYVNTGAGTTDLTGAACNANTVHWSYDTFMLARSTGGAIVEKGGKDWFFVTANYLFGHQLQRDTTRFVRAAGGRVVGTALYPFPEVRDDFATYLLPAQASGASVVGLCNAGEETVRSIRAAHAYGLTTQGQRLAGLLATIDAVHALGLEVAAGVLLTESYYWDLDDRTRALDKRLRPRTGGLAVNMAQAGCYAGVRHYLKAVAAGAPAEDGAAVVARMKAMPTDDDAFGAGSVRGDGRFLCPAHLFEVKAPAESRGPWDYYRLLATVPAAEAAPALVEEACPLARPV